MDSYNKTEQKYNQSGLYKRFDDGLTLFLRIQLLGWAIVAWSVVNIIVQRNVCSGSVNSCQTLLLEDRFKTAGGLLLCGLIIVLGIVGVVGKRPKKTDMLFLLILFSGAVWLSALVANVDILGCPKYAPDNAICLVRTPNTT